jgi:MFS family permease
MGISGGMISALGFVIGPALGGLITYTLGWRSVFYVSFCLGIVGLLGAQFILRDEEASARDAQTKEPFDWIGTATFALSLTALLLGLTAGQKGLWHTTGVRVELAVAALSLAGFIGWEGRTRHPLLDLQLFRIRLFAAGNVARLTSFVSVAMNQLLMPFFLQLGLGLDALRAGLLMATASIGLGVLSPFTGWISDRIGARLLSSAGLACMGSAFLSLRFVDLGASTADIVLRLGLLGIGLGLFQTPNNNALMSSIPSDRLGVGSSFLSIVRSLGLSIGVATASAIVSAKLVAVTGQTSLDSLRGGALSASKPLALGAFMEGYRAACTTAAVLCFLGALAAGVRTPSSSPPWQGGE